MVGLNDSSSSLQSLSFTRWDAIPYCQALHQFDDHTLYYFAGHQAYLHIIDHGYQYGAYLPSKCEHFHGYGKSLYIICNEKVNSNSSDEITTVRKIYKVTYERERNNLFSIDYVRDMSDDETIHDALITTTLKDGRQFFYRFCDHPTKDRIIVDFESSNEMYGFKMVDIHRNKLIYVKVVDNSETKIVKLSMNVVLITTESFTHLCSASDDIPLWFLYRNGKTVSVFDIDKYEHREEEPPMRSFCVGDDSSDLHFCFLAAEPFYKQCNCDGIDIEMMKLKGKKRELALASYPSKFLNTFKIRKILGQGGYGCVFKATTDDNSYAVKKIAVVARNNTRDIENKLDAARREVTAMEQLKHNHIVQYFDSWLETPPTSWQLSADEIILDEMELSEEEKSVTRMEWAKRPYMDGTRFLYIQMEICNHGSLDQWLSTNTDRERERMISWFAQIVSAVAYMHSKGFIHRDLKPSNILFADRNHLKICDLGLATEIAIQGETEVSLTRTTVGTRLYWAPEQTFFKYTSKVDIFSLGLIFIEMLIHMDESQRACEFKNYRSGMTEPLLADEPLLNKLLERMSTPETPKQRPDCKDILEELIALTGGMTIIEGEVKGNSTSSEGSDRGWVVVPSE